VGRSGLRSLLKRETRKAQVFRGVNQLSYEEPVPAIAPDEVLVQVVVGVSVGYQKSIPHEPPHLCMAGVIAAVGNEVINWE